MTREDFERWCVDNQIQVGGPRLVPCDCGDVSCHGWRFVPIDVPTLDEVAGAVSRRVLHRTKLGLRLAPLEHEY